MFKATAHTAQIFHTSSQANVSRQTHFLFCGYYLHRLLAYLAVTDYFLQGYIKSKVHETCPANIDDLKQQILKCMQGIPKNGCNML
jgi:hypothetical protein